VKNNFKIYLYDTIPYLSAIILENIDKSKKYYITHHLFYKRVKFCPSVSIEKNDESYPLYEQSINKFLELYANDAYLLLDNRKPINKNRIDDIPIKKNE